MHIGRDAALSLTELDGTIVAGFWSGIRYSELRP
jgi:hypothetical protein